MNQFSSREKELLHQLFSPDFIKQLVNTFSGSIESQWRIIYGKILDGGTGESAEADINLILYVDGAANLDKNEAGIGGVFYLDKGDDQMGDPLYTFSESIGKATNNEAEYRSLLKGLEYAELLRGRNIKIRSDSELLVKQLNLEYKVKNKRLLRLYQEVRKKLTSFNSWNIAHVMRGQNKIADNLSKQGLNQD